MVKIICKTEHEASFEAARRIEGNTVAVSGGGTYKKIFSHWAVLESLKNKRFYPVDERLVPFDDADCNWNVATRELLDPLGLQSQKENWAMGAQQYLELLKKEFPQGVIFDAVFLGMGEDGHTASLFPGGDYLRDEKSIVLETQSPKPPYNRVTLGLGPLWNAKNLFLVVLGGEKKEVLKRVFTGDSSLPITLALGGHPNPVVIMDEGAAS